MPRNPIHERPLVACEIFADRVLAARTTPERGVIELHTARQLPAGVVTPSLTQVNVADAAALTAVIQEALAVVAARARDVIAIVPDAAVRVVLLDFDSLPEDAKEAAGIIRFRMKKSLPFDVEDARLAFHTYRNAGAVKVIATVMLASVLEEYESAFLRAGYTPGVVVPSALAALGAVESSQPSLVVKVGATSTTLAIVDQDELRLFRSLEASVVNGDAAPLANEIYPSLVFYQDTFGSGVEQVLVAGACSAAQLAPVLATHFETPVKDLVAERFVASGLGADTKSGILAGVVGGLLG